MNAASMSAQTGQFGGSANYSNGKAYGVNFGSGGAAAAVPIYTSPQVNAAVGVGTNISHVQRNVSANHSVGIGVRIQF